MSCSIMPMNFVCFEFDVIKDSCIKFEVFFISVFSSLLLVKVLFFVSFLSREKEFLFEIETVLRVSSLEVIDSFSS